MGIQVVSFAQVVCDSCGAVRPGPEPDHTSARLAAAVHGWTYRAYSVKGKNRRVHGGRPGQPDAWTVETVPRSWDCCPDCPLPDTPEQAAEIRAGRKAKGPHGAWVDKEQA